MKRTNRCQIYLGAHLLVSICIAAGLAIVVRTLWFPPPFAQLAGGLTLFWWIISVDLITGPLLSFLLIKPSKSPKAIAVDLTTIAVLQLSALTYGLYTLANARPLAVVFEVDRFRVLTYSDITEPDLKDAPSWFNPWTFSLPRFVGLNEAKSIEEKMSSVNGALHGVDAAQRPSRWQDYEKNRPEILERARPLSALLDRYPFSAKEIDQIIGNAGLTTAEAQWLPVTSRHSANWIAIINPATAAVVDYLPLEGFF